MVQLTERDQAILTTLYHLRVLDILQIDRLFFQGTGERPSSRTYKRVKKLVDASYLAMEKEAGGAKLSLSRLTLTPKGITKAADLLGLPKNEYRGTKLIKRGHFLASENRPPKSEVEHQLRVNDIRVALQQSGPIIGEIDWTDARQLKMEYPDWPITPDARVRIGDCTFYVEVDTGTERAPKWQRKLRGYAQTWAHPPCKGASLLYVLLDTKNRVPTSRVNLIQELVRKEMGSIIQTGLLDVKVASYAQGTESLIKTINRAAEWGSLSAGAEVLLYTIGHNADLKNHQLHVLKNPFPGLKTPYLIRYTSYREAWFVLDDCTTLTVGDKERLASYPDILREYRQRFTSPPGVLVMLEREEDGISLVEGEGARLIRFTTPNRIAKTDLSKAFFKLTEGGNPLSVEAKMFA